MTRAVPGCDAKLRAVVDIGARCAKRRGGPRTGRHAVNDLVGEVGAQAGIRPRSVERLTE
jgi:hypothetical protein